MQMFCVVGVANRGRCEVFLYICILAYAGQDAEMESERSHQETPGKRNRRANQTTLSRQPSARRVLLHFCRIS